MKKTLKFSLDQPVARLPVTRQTVTRQDVTRLPVTHETVGHIYFFGENIFRSPSIFGFETASCSYFDSLTWKDTKTLQNNRIHQETQQILSKN